MIDFDMIRNSEDFAQVCWMNRDFRNALYLVIYQALQDITFKSSCSGRINICSSVTLTTMPSRFLSSPWITLTLSPIAKEIFPYNDSEIESGLSLDTKEDSMLAPMSVPARSNMAISSKVGYRTLER